MQSAIARLPPTHMHHWKTCTAKGHAGQSLARTGTDRLKVIIRRRVPWWGDRCIIPRSGDDGCVGTLEASPAKKRYEFLHPSIPSHATDLTRRGSCCASIPSSVSRLINDIISSV